MAYDDRSVKPMSSSLLRAQIGTKLLAGLYDTVPTMMTSAIRLSVDLPGAAAASAGPPFAFNIAISPAWCSGIQGARLVARRKIDIAWLNPSVIASMAYHGRGAFRKPLPLRALAVFPSYDRLVVAVARKHGIRSMDELKRRRPALRVSVATNDCIDFAISAGAAGPWNEPQDLRGMGRRGGAGGSAQQSAAPGGHRLRRRRRGHRRGAVVLGGRGRGTGDGVPALLAQGHGAARPLRLQPRAPERAAVRRQAARAGHRRGLQRLAHRHPRRAAGRAGLPPGPGHRADAGNRSATIRRRFHP